MLWRHLSGSELSAYLDGELSPRARERAEAHLASCERCSLALAGLRQVSRAVAQLGPCHAPPDLRHRVRTALASEPIPTLTCRKAAPLLQEYVDRQLGPVMVAAVQSHLRSCLRCRTELMVLRSLVQVLRAVPSLPAPSAVRERVWAAGRQLAPPAITPWSARWRPALAAAGVLAALVAGILLRPQWRPAQIARQEPAPAAPGLDLTAAPPAPPTAPPTARPAPTQPSVVTARGPEEMAPARPSVPPRSHPAHRTERPAVVLAHGPAPEPRPAPGESLAARPAEALPAAVVTLRAVASAARAESASQGRLAALGERFTALAWESGISLPPPSSPTTPAAGSGGRGEDCDTSPGSDAGRVHSGLRSTPLA